MGWKLLDNKELLTRVVKESRVIGMRSVCLGSPPSDALLAAMNNLASVPCIGWKRVLEMRIYNSFPCVVTVFDSVNRESIGAYVHTGINPIRSSKDPGVVELANMLDHEFDPTGLGLVR